MAFYQTEWNQIFQSLLRTWFSLVENVVSLSLSTPQHLSYVKYEFSILAPPSNCHTKYDLHSCGHNFFEDELSEPRFIGLTLISDRKMLAKYHFPITHFCFRFHYQARNSVRRSMNPEMKYIFGISRSRRTEWHPTSMIFFISNDFSLKKCHFCFRFHFRAQNSARRSMNSEMKYIFGISRSKHTRWVPETCGFFCFTPLYTQKSSRAILSLIVLCAPSRFCGVARDSLLAALMKGQWTIKSV